MESNKIPPPVPEILNTRSKKGEILRENARNTRMSERIAVKNKKGKTDGSTLTAQSDTPSRTQAA